MEIRYVYAQALFGVVFAIVVARYFGAEWWGYVLAMPAVGALAYYLSLRRLRSLGLKPSTTFIEYTEELRRRWNTGD
jgi:hypothetical protein